MFGDILNPLEIDHRRVSWTGVCYQCVLVGSRMTVLKNWSTHVYHVFTTVVCFSLLTGLNYAYRVFNGIIQYIHCVKTTVHLGRFFMKTTWILFATSAEFYHVIGSQVDSFERSGFVSKDRPYLRNLILLFF